MGGDRQGWRNDDRWDRKFEGQKFSEWSAEEKDEVNNRVKDWANAPATARISRRRSTITSSTGGRSKAAAARLAASERKAFLEIAHGFATRNPKQVYAFISRHYNSNNHKGKWSEEKRRS